MTNLLKNSGNADFAKSERIGNCMIITINRPKERNPISGELFELVERSIKIAEADNSIGAIILTGASLENGKSFFCSGGDLNALAALREYSPAQRRETLEVLHNFTRAVRGSNVPFIAAVEGGAAGAGCSIALTCDFVISAKEAMFSVAYVNVGLTPDGGVTSFLADILPRQLANEMCLLGKPLLASRLYDLGVVNELTAAEDALAKALIWGEKLANGPRKTIATIKHLCAAATENSLEQQLELEAVKMVEAQGLAEAKEGIEAFFGKRKPVYNQ
ncbi:MAG: enoyl-CoA hydratase/isomerase family protein [Rhizobiales bacterium]|nr:enoyl-CoA hydratase family protein [Hyphomicrobiales bacterium]NRB13283.1 enoyl-CoA hydratase/isomerase family protein [Hyphomicrobiales bacterium]